MVKTNLDILKNVYQITPTTPETKKPFNILFTALKSMKKGHL